MIRHFYLSGLLIALFFILLIITKRRKNLSDYLLVFFIFLLGTNLLIIYSLSDRATVTPLVILLDIFYWVLLGPTLYIYADLLISKKKQYKWRYLITLIPLGICMIGFSPYIFGETMAFFSSFQTDSFFYQFCLYVWFYNSPLFYILTILNIRSHRKNIRNYFSYSEQVDLKWLYYLSNGFAIYLLSLLAPSLLKQYLGIDLKIRSFNYSWIVLIAYIFMIGYFGFRQKNIFSDHQPSLLNEKAALKPATRSSVSILNRQKSYQKSGLNESESKQLLNRLLELMNRDEPYLNSEINLQSLATMLNTSSHKLSQVINENLGKNFYDFINEYRLKKFKEQLPQFNDELYNITSLAFACGFNSKSAFYNIFKKFEKMTPTQYIKQIKLKIS